MGERISPLLRQFWYGFNVCLEHVWLRLMSTMSRLTMVDLTVVNLDASWERCVGQTGLLLSPRASYVIVSRCDVKVNLGKFMFVDTSRYSYCLSANSY